MQTLLVCFFVALSGFRTHGFQLTSLRPSNLPSVLLNPTSHVQHQHSCYRLRVEARRGLMRLGVTRLDKRKNSDVARPGVEPVQVFDKVFSSQIAEGLGDCPPGVYKRSLPAAAVGSEASAAHEFIESVLVAAGDDGREVEYWGRTEWLGVDTHRDCDEGAAAKGMRRFPARVYIAYLDIENGVVAPTVLWTPDAEGNQKDQHGRLWAVPAVSGRLVSFEGSLLHGVPRPALQYVGVRDAEPDTTKRRHVLIMNSWRDHAPSDDDDEYDTVLDRVQPSLDNSRPLDKLTCEPRASWQPIAAQRNGAGDGSGYSFSVSTFTGEGFVTQLHASKQDLASMLLSSSTPCCLTTISECTGNAADLHIGVPSVAGSYSDDLDWKAEAL